MLKDRKKEALVFGDKTYSYHSLLLYANYYSTLIKGKPKHVMIVADNSPEWIFAFYSAWQVGATVIPIDASSTDKELAYYITDCKPDLVYCSNKTENTVKQAAFQSDFYPQLINFEKIDVSNIDENKPVIEIKAGNPEDVAVIIYTSGTTGSPKGVMLTYNNINTNITAVSKGIPIYQENDRVLLLLPLHHVFPLLGSMAAVLKVGCTSVMTKSLKSNDIINTLQQNKVSIIIAVPRFYSIIHQGIMSKIESNKVAKALFKVASKINSRKFSKKLFKKVHDQFGGHVKFLISGGAALSTKIGADFKTLGFDLLTGYGMTEASPMISFTRPGKWKKGSAGEIMPNMEVKIVDGEITAKGGNIMKGYFNRPEETNEILKDGWLYTGDLGHLDDKNRIYITGRKKEIIVLSNGKNINPSLIEEDLMNSIEGFDEIAVLQYEDKLHLIIRPLEEFLERFSTHKEIENYFKEQLQVAYNDKVSPYKRVFKFTLIDDELPRTKLGKVQRYKLEKFIDRPMAERKRAYAEDESFKELDMIINYLQKQKSIEVLPSHNLDFDLGLDSLDQVSFQVYIEKTFGVELSGNSFSNFPNVKHLAEFVKKQKKRISEETFNWTEILKEKYNNISLPRSTWYGQATIKMSKLFFKTFFRLRYYGLSNLPKNQSFIIAPNHQSYFDGFLIASLLKRRMYKNTIFYAKKKHFNNKLLQYIAKTNNTILVDAQINAKHSIQQMAHALKQNKNIIIFPEGTRTNNGHLGNFKETFAILSRELNVPIIPVSIDGAYNALPKGAMFPKPFTKVIVNFLEPIYPKDLSYQTITQKVRNKISKKMRG